MSTPHTYLISLIFLAGLAGGFANYVRESKPREDRTWSDHVAPFSLGIVAAFATPLFLSLAKSTLIEDLIKIYSDTGTFGADIFVFFGFCLVAALSSRVFLERLTEQVLSLKEDVQKLDSKTHENQEELEAIEENIAPASEYNGNTPEGDDTEQSIVSDLSKLTELDALTLKALIDKPFTWRSIAGLRKDLSLSRPTTIRVLDGLLKRQFVDQKLSKTGNSLYRITAVGKKYT